MARDDHDVDSLIGLIYEAALDPGLWSQALVNFSALSESVGAHLIIVDKPRLRPLSMAAGRRRMTADLARLYLNHYVAIDPFRTVVISMPAGNSLICTDYITEDFVARSEFFQDYLLKVGGRFLAAWMLDNDASYLIALGAHRREAPFERAEATRWASLMTHFRRAVRLGMLWEDESARRAASTLSSNQAELAWLLVDGSARVLDTSGHAARLLDLGALLRLGPARRLSAPDDEQTRRVRSFVAAVAAGQGGGAFTLRGRNGAVCCIDALPCGINAPGLLRPELATCALLCVRGPARPSLLHPAVVRAALGCTQAEADVAISLAAGLSPSAIAEARNVSLTTVRSQIRALFLAAGVNRVSELVAQITGTAPARE